LNHLKKIFELFVLLCSPRYFGAVESSSIGKDPAPVIDPEIAALDDGIFERLSKVSTDKLT
jgi:hypothetical protein